MGGRLQIAAVITEGELLLSALPSELKEVIKRLSGEGIIHSADDEEEKG
jgi:hypothetical protein